MAPAVPVVLPAAVRACGIALWRVDHPGATRREASVLLHAAARHLLQRCHGVVAAAWSIGRHGKPALAGGGPPYFSLSHGRGVSCIALCGAADVGVDLEALAGWPVVAGRPVAFDHVFTPAEQAWLAGRGAAGLYGLWARKEAALKALGCGFAVDPRRCCVAPRGDGQAGDGGRALRLWSLDAAIEGHALALACRLSPSLLPV